MGISSEQDRKKNNRRAELEGREVETEKNVAEAPSGSNMNIPLELPIIKKYHDHPFLQINLRAAGGNPDDDSEKEEEGKFTSIVSSLKKRKEQRKEQKEYKKKARGTKGSIDETRRFEMQAAAANRQIKATESKNMIEFLRLAHEVSMLSRDEMKEMFLSAKRNIFGEEPAEAPTEPETEAVDVSIDSDDFDDTYT